MLRKTRNLGVSITKEATYNEGSGGDGGRGGPRPGPQLIFLLPLFLLVSFLLRE